jgi:hypothetical protein
MGWGKVWIIDDNPIIKEVKQAMLDAMPKVYSGIDLGTGDSQTILTTFEYDKFTHSVISTEELYKNIPPTHDPYINPNANIYYECACGAILDPNTKSFAALNNYASEKGWKVRFGADSYVPYCVECGKGVE